MSDFIIVLAVAILGLLAQAAGGKKQRRLVTASSNSFSSDGSGSTSHPNPSPNVVESATQSQTNYATEPAKAELTSQFFDSGGTPSSTSDASESAASLAATDHVASTSSIAEAVPAHPAEVKADGDSSAKTDANDVQPFEANSRGENASDESGKGQLGDGQSADSSKSADVEPAEGSKSADVESAELSKSADVQPGQVSKPADVEPAEVSKSADVQPAEVHQNLSLAAGLKTDEDVASPPTITTESGTASASASSATAPASGAASESTTGHLPSPQFEDYVSRKPGIEFFLRLTIFLWFLGLALFFFITNTGALPTELLANDPWVAQCTFITCALTGFTLIKSFRSAVSFICSCIEALFDLNTLRSLTRNWSVVKTSFVHNRVFVPSSIPHMMALFIFIQTMFYLLSSMSPKNDFGMPGLPIALPLPLDQLFSYNGLGLVTLAFCGAGIFVTRNFKEVMQRLALVKPTAPQVGIGFGLIFMSFLYDYLWSLYTHNAGLGLDMKLAGYNGGTFAAEGGFSGALILALATALCAGIGEETLIRGGLQAVFGLVPAAIMHGVLHAQFQHAPIFIVQVAGWSILMGIVKKYTNTTTTIIGHAGFNFVTSFLFAFNP